MRAGLRKQSGVSFFGLVFFGSILALLGVITAQVVPTFLEYQAIQKAAQRASTGTNVPEVRQIFDKAADIDDIHSVKGKDLEISKEGDKVVVSYASNREIHLAGPAFLVIKYSGRSK
jgi:hypothetical protein